MLLFALMVIGAGEPITKADAEAKYAELVAPLRAARIKELEAEAKELRKGRSSKEKGAAVKAMNAELKRLKDPRTPFVPTIHVGEMSVGQVGALVAGKNRNDVVNHFEASEVIGPDSMLVRLAYETDGRPPRKAYTKPFMVKGIPTAGVISDKEIELPGVFAVTGTAQHFGRSVPVVERIEPKTK